MIIQTITYARAGLLGNPSDGYFGKTISFDVRNFQAGVTLWESPTLNILPNRISDPTEFSDLADVYATAKRDGYYGGLRLLFATCKRFYDYCQHHDIVLPKRNFTIQYHTTIPRQVGLAGSSGIIASAFKALMQFYEVSEAQIPKPVQPNIILSVEREELGISAGLQDRVIQTYGGCVYMDFSRDLMERSGHGRYEPVDPRLLPGLYLAYISEPSDSGVIHNDVRFRWEKGDPVVREAMQTFASYAEQGKAALEARDYKQLGTLMDANFDLRRKIFGDAVIGPKNLRMVGIGRKLGAPAKFSGSGGAILGMYHSKEHLEQLRQAYESEGFDFVCVDTGYTPANCS